MTMTVDTTVSCESDIRPWGTWQVLDEGPGYKVKRLVVSPGARLSYQSHKHRSESWVVVTGVATCTIDGMVRPARVGAVIEVPRGAWHRLANNGTEDLVIVEVQLGSYTGEDDVCRHANDYYVRA
jgi:mannose-6-phosphate isomerase